MEKFWLIANGEAYVCETLRDVLALRARHGGFIKHIDTDGNTRRLTEDDISDMIYNTMLQRSGQP